MSGKANTQVGRRTPLSLNGAAGTPRQQTGKLQSGSIGTAVTRGNKKDVNHVEQTLSQNSEKSQNGLSLTVENIKDKKETEKNVNRMKPERADKTIGNKEQKLEKKEKESEHKSDVKAKKDEEKTIGNKEQKLEKKEKESEPKSDMKAKKDEVTESGKTKKSEPEVVKEKKNGFENSKTQNGKSESAAAKNSTPEVVQVTKNEPKVAEIKNQESVEKNLPKNELGKPSKIPVSEQKVIETKSVVVIPPAVEDPIAKPITEAENQPASVPINDIEMEPIRVSPSPVKVFTVVSNPTATSTPGKIKEKVSSQDAVKSNIPLPFRGEISPHKGNIPRVLHISGRRSIRPMTDYTPTHFQGSKFRESYRRINTELDVTSTSNTSLNVTVGSEIPNNSSFSFFGLGRKRERTPLKSQSATELRGDGDITPPKRARLDIHGFITAVASPISMLRNRFSKTSIQSSTPVKTSSKLEVADDNGFTGISIEEEMPDVEETIAIDDITVGNKPDFETATEIDILTTKNDDKKEDNKSNAENDANEKIMNDEIPEIPIVSSAGATQHKKDRCSIM